MRVQSSVFRHSFLISLAQSHRYLTPGSLKCRSITTEPKRNYAFAFDVDGVLIRGSKVLPQAQRALRLLNGENPQNRVVPFILLTNGGGVTEEKKAADLSEILGVKITPSELVLAHSPMRSLANMYHDKAVLVIGGEGVACREVAESYGFNKVIMPNDVLAWNPSVWPFKKLSEQEKLETREHDFSKTLIEAVMVFHDSRNWGRDIQIAIDVFKAHSGKLGTLKSDFGSQEVQLFFSNPDIIWSNDFPVPRMAQGSFRVALDSLYHEMTGHRLRYTLFGKPQRETYNFAERMLVDKSRQLALEYKNVYAVGDNPEADVAGANAYGWTSILVRTGVFSGYENDKRFPAFKIVEDVEEAVRWVLEREEGLTD